MSNFGESKAIRPAAPAADRFKPARKKQTDNDLPMQVLFILPALVLFTLFIVYPAGMTLLYSFTDWTGISLRFNFIGIDNYVTMFRSPEIFVTIPVTLYFAALNAVMLISVAFFVALMLNRKSRITNFLRVCFFLPMLVAALIVGFVFKEFYSPVVESTMGTLNRILGLIGLKALQSAWLTNQYTAMLIVVVTGVWYQVGTTALIYLANMQSISKDLYEAAEIDGAGYWKQTFHITFRMIAPALRINLILLLINSMQQFTMISILTGGGPGTATKVINLAIVEYTIGAYRVGLGSAMAMVVTAVIFLLVILAQRIVSKFEERDV